MKITIRRTLGVALLTAWCILAAAANVEPPRQPTELNIPAQPLRDALTTFGRQTGLQVIYTATEVTDALSAPPVVGTFTAQDALGRLLANTGLRYEYLDARTVAIRTLKPRFEADAALSTEKTAARTAEDLRLARLESAPSDAMQKVESSPSRNAESRSEMNAGVAEGKESTKGIPEILVKGKRSLNSDIQRTEDDIQPYVVFTSEEIRRSNASNLEQFLRTRLPMNQVLSTNSQIVSGTDGNRSQIDLRGLGTEETLILVNGRRVPGVSLISRTGNMGQPDINGIPVTAVERIEVLPSTAGGIYGGGATGGVVNIILKRDYAGVEVRANYTNTFDTDAAQRRLDVSGGFSLEGGKTHVVISASSLDANDLLSRDRGFAQRGRDLMYRNAPEMFFLVYSSPVLGYTTNIRNTVYNSTFTGFADLVLDDGTPLNSPYTHVPSGYAGTAGDHGHAFVANAGSYTFNLPDDQQGGRQSLVTGPKVNSLALNLRRDFGKRLEGFLELSRNESESVARFSQVNSSLVIAASAPNNPFTTDIMVGVALPGVEFQNRSISTTLSGTLGAIARLPWGWMTEIDYGWGRSGYAQDGYPLPYLRTLDGGIANGTVDVLKDLNAYPANLSAYIFPTTSKRGPSDATLKNATARLAGPIFRLPGGPLTLSSLYEWRKESAESVVLPGYDSYTGQLQGYTLHPQRVRTTNSVYLEAFAPLVSQRNALPGVRVLELQVSGRADKHATNSLPSPAYGGRLFSPSPEGPFAAVTYTRADHTSKVSTVGLRYMPLEDMTVRASYATGFLPPNFSQAASYLSPNGFFYGRDTKRGNQSLFLSMPVTYGGSPNLKPERSRSWSFGAILTPRMLPGVRVSLDYTDIYKADEIAGLNSDTALILEDMLPGRIIRGPLTPADIANGYTAGPVIRFDGTDINIAHTRVKAVDAQLDYEVTVDNLGAFRFFTLVSRQTRLARQYLPTSPSVNTVGYSDGPMELAGNAGITWARDSWALGWAAQFVDSKRVYPSVTQDAAAIAAEVRRYGASALPHQIYHDISFRYRFEESARALHGLLANSEIMLGIQNVFDKDPPIIPVIFSSGGYSYYGDPRLRRYSISVQRNF